MKLCDTQISLEVVDDVVKVVKAVIVVFFDGYDGVVDLVLVAGTAKAMVAVGWGVTSEAVWERGSGVTA